MIKFIIIGGILILAIIGGVVVFWGEDSTDVGLEASRPNGGVGVNINIAEDNEETESGNAVTFIITGESFKFMMNGVENPDLVVKKGDTVRIEFESTSGFHDWVLDEFNAATQKVNSGDKTSVEFVADETGTFEYYCSVGSHRQQGMSGNFIVE